MVVINTWKIQSNLRNYWNKIKLDFILLVDVEINYGLSGWSVPFIIYLIWSSSRHFLFWSKLIRITFYLVFVVNTTSVNASNIDLMVLNGLI